jgi:predicted nucleic acid-binding protein
VAVVCDTTPINYLVQIGLIDLVPRLFGNACIPEAVLSELLHPSAPRNVREFASALPEWMVVKTAVEIKEPAILALDKGEREAIALSFSWARSSCSPMTTRRELWPANSGSRP